VEHGACSTARSLVLGEGRMSLILAVVKKGSVDFVTVKCGEGDYTRAEALRSAVAARLAQYTDVTVSQAKPILGELNHTTGYMVLVCCDGEPASIIRLVGGIIDAFRAGHQPN